MNYCRKPLVSVIITTYNRANVLKNAIDSVLNQTYSNVEIIVIDDGSEDDTNFLMKAYGDKIVSIFKSNTGKSHSRNIGLLASNGSIIATLDSDDIWCPSYLAKTINHLLNNNLDIVFSACLAHSFKYCKYNKGQYYVFDYKEIRESVLRQCPAPTSGVIMQRTIIGDGWDVASMEYEDWHLQIECIIKNINCRVGFVSEILWEKREDDKVKNKLKTTQQNQRQTHDTNILLIRLQQNLTENEYSIVKQNYIKDTIRLLLVLIRNSESRKKIWQTAYMTLSEPTLLFRMIFNVLLNKIR